MAKYFETQWLSKKTGKKIPYRTKTLTSYHYHLHASCDWARTIEVTTDSILPIAMIIKTTDNRKK